MPKVPRWTFFYGGLVAVLLGVPLLAVAIRWMARVLLVGDSTKPLDEVLVLAAVFAGIPALVTGGGVARLVSHRTAEKQGGSGSIPWRVLVEGTLAMGFAGAGLAFLVAVPLGGMPEAPLEWAKIAVVGLVVGLLIGLASGGLALVRTRRHR